MEYDFSNITVTDISKVISVKLREGSGMMMSDRETEGLIVALSGTVIYRHDSREYISDPSHALLLARGTNYSFKSLGDSVSIVINFSLKDPLPFPGIESIETDAKNMAIRMENTWSFQKKSFRLKCIDELYSFFISNDGENLYIPSTERLRIEPSIRYLEEHYTDPELSNDELAAPSGVSTVYFRKLFTRIYGMSPMKYVRCKRIEKAKNILESPYATSISDVAEVCGFNSVYYFSKAFRQETSCSPSLYGILARSKHHVTF